MNAQQSTYPAHQQAAHLWTPLLAAVLLAIALIVGAAGILAMTAKSGTTSPVFVPQSINSHEHAAVPTPLGVPFPGGLAGPSQLNRSLGMPPGYITMNGLNEGVTTSRSVRSVLDQQPRPVHQPDLPGRAVSRWRGRPEPARPPPHTRHGWPLTRHRADPIGPRTPQLPRAPDSSRGSTLSGRGAAPQLDPRAMIERDG